MYFYTYLTEKRSATAYLKVLDSSSINYQVYQKKRDTVVRYFDAFLILIKFAYFAISSAEANIGNDVPRH